MKHKITIELDTERLSTLTDQALANAWHIAQANPAPMEDRDACELAEHVGREIISRWLTKTPPELWSRQGSHHFWHILQKHGSWLPVNGDDNNREWTPTKTV